ncbi:primosomal replication protein N [Stenoxybacter acetivorans]|uniref:primosomal replication protein N n=1 Tax=Stenoxybacter acetivorans TaxID=422441 RepID=UPI0005614981|nr:primosomal replication protein N [Stenoxybacter acetivorans]
MDNRLRLSAQIKSLETIRYTPAGLPVLHMWLSHESWQAELGERYLAKMEIEAKALGEMALNWQYQVGDCVEISGFLAQKGLRHTRSVLHIQSIHENKG